MKIKLMKAEYRCAHFMFFSVTTKMRAINKHCKGYCCYSNITKNDIKNRKECEYFIPNILSN